MSVEIPVATVLIILAIAYIVPLVLLLAASNVRMLVLETLEDSN